ncbi:MAG: hypothetical protein MUC56_09030 [Thermoanaerobaculales bacterium]|jgi:hypothetical protein|nr:hypothetical protein [Thermoanaerobaculales bacterium]
MDTKPHQPSKPAAARRHQEWTRIAACALSLAVAMSAHAQTRRSGGRATPERPFERIVVVDRSMAELEVWRSLAASTGTDRFQPVVLHAGEDERWTASLERLLELVPDGEVVWVSDRGTPVGLQVDGVVHPDELAVEDRAEGPVVVSAEAGLDGLAALVAMRLDGRLSDENPGGAGPAVVLGGGPILRGAADLHLPTRADALSFVNRLAGSRVVMVVREGGLLPEHLLWAFQRDALILEVDPPPYGIYDPWSELAAVAAVRRQIRDGLADLLDGAAPEVLVIAGDWHEIPFRYPHGVGAAGQPPTGYPGPCPGCDNGVYELAADLLYADLDLDPWGVPDVPVGRLMSPVRDLLAIQSVVGIWSEHGAFPPAGDGVFLGLLGTAAPYRQAVVEAWRDAFPERLWSAIGPERPTRGYRLDREGFFDIADRSDIVVLNSHGHPDFVSPDGLSINQSLWGELLVERGATGLPAFWFLHACSTGKPDRPDLIAEQTLLVGLQSRLALGSLMAVEVLGSASGDPYWWSDAVEAGQPVGELVRRFAAAAAVAYGEGEVLPEGLPSASGSAESRAFNRLAVLSWIGDPLTPIDHGR